MTPPEPTCPRCGQAYPYGDPRGVISDANGVRRQCFECDQNQSKRIFGAIKDPPPLKAAGLSYEEYLAGWPESETAVRN